MNLQGSQTVDGGQQADFLLKNHMNLQGSQTGLLCTAFLKSLKNHMNLQGSQTPSSFGGHIMCLRTI